MKGKGLLLVLLFCFPLVAFGQEDAISSLLKGLRSSKKAEQKQALLQLEKMGEAAHPALPHILNLLEDPDPEIAKLSNRVLDSFGKDILPSLLPFLSQESKPRLQRNTARVIGRRGERALGWFSDQIKNSSEADRIKATKALNVLARYGVVNEDSKVFPELMKGLVKGLGHSSQKLSSYSERVLSKVGTPAIPYILSHLARHSLSREESFVNTLVAMGTKAVPYLEKSLKSPNKKVRIFGARTLQRLGHRSQPAMKGLLEGLGDEEVRVRDFCARTLALLGEPAIPSLLKALEGGKEPLQREVLITLGHMGNQAEKALPLLTRLLEKSESSLQDQIILTLGKIGPSAGTALPVLVKVFGDSPPSTKNQILKTIEQIGPPRNSPQVVSQLKDFFKSSRPEVRDLSAHIIGSMGKQALPDLLPLLSSDERQLQQLAFRGLLAVGEDALPTLITLLKSPKAPLQEGALGTLKEMGNKATSAIPPLIDILGSSKGTMASRVKETLSSLFPASEEELPSLIKSLSSAQETVIEYAKRAILSIPKISLNKSFPLALLLSSPDKELQRFAQTRLVRLAKIYPSEFISLISQGTSTERDALMVLFRGLEKTNIELLLDFSLSLKKPSPQYLESLAKLGPRALPILIDRWKKNSSSDFSRKLSLICGAMGKEGLPLALGLFFDPLAEKDGREALIKIGEPAILPLMTHLLQSDRVAWNLMICSARWAGQMDGGKLFAYFQKNTTHRETEIFALLARMGKPAVPYLIEILAEKEPYKTNALKSLVEIGKAAIPDLINAFALQPESHTSSPEFQREKIYLNLIKDGVILVLVRIGTPAIPSLVNTFSGEDSLIRAYGAMTLSAMGTRAIPFLRQGLKSTDPKVQSLSAKVLGDLGPRAKKVVPDLVEALKSPHTGVQTFTQEALVKIGYSSIEEVTKLLRESQGLTLQKLCIEILGKLGKRAGGAVPLILKLLDEKEDEALRIACVDSLVSMEVSREKAAPLFFKVLGQAQSEELKIGLIRAYGTLQIKKAIPLLIGRKISPSFYIRRASSEALAQLFPPTRWEIPGLIDLLRHKNPFIRQFAGEALEPMGREVVEPLISLLGENQAGREAVKILARLKIKGTSSLILTVKDDTLPMKIRKRAIEALGLSQVARGAAPLLKIYSSLPSKLQREAQSAIIRIGRADSSDTSLLGDLLLHQEEWIRKEAARMLQKIDHPSGGVASLLKALEKAPAEEKKAAQITLIRLGKRALSPLAKDLARAKPAYRALLIQTLGQMGKAALQELARLLEKENTREAAALALSRFGKGALPLLLKSLSNGPSQKGAALSLGKMGKIALPSLLERMEKNPEPVALAIAHMGAEALPMLLEKANSSSSPSVLRGVVLGLLLMGKEGYPTLLNLWENNPKILAFLKAEVKKRKPKEFLVHSLSSSQGAVRAQALSLLAEIPESLPLLTRALSQPGLRVAAREAITKMGTPAIVALVADLKSSEASRRFAAVSALSNIGRPAWRAIDDLLGVLEDPDPRVAKEAARALERIGNLAVPKLLSSYRENSSKRVIILSILGQVGSSKAVDLMVEALKDSSRSLRLAGLEGLKNLKQKNEKVLQAFLSVIEDSDSQIRQGAVEGIGEMGKKASSAVPHLLKRLADPSYPVSRGAKEALSQIGLPSSGAIPALISLLDHKDVEVRRNAISLLSQMGACFPYLKDPLQSGSPVARRSVMELLEKIPPQEDLISPLVGLFSAPDPALRQYACKLVSRSGEKALKPLTKALSSEKALVRECAIQTLGLLGERASSAAGALVKRLEDGQDYQNHLIKNALAQIGPSSLAPLSAYLFHREYKIRLVAVQVVEKIGERASFLAPKLREVLQKEEESEIRKQAVAALGKMKPSAPVLSALLLSLKDGESAVRGEGQRALEAFSKVAASSETVALLKVSLQEENSLVRKQSLSLLSKMSEKAKEVRPLFVKALVDSNGDVALVAAQALSHLGLRRSQDLGGVLPLLERGRVDFRVALLKALQRSSFALPDGPLARVAKLLEDESVEVRSAAARALGRGGERAYPYLREALKSPLKEVQFAALESLGKGGPKGLSLLSSFQNSGDSQLHQRAVLSLLELGKDGLKALVQELDSPDAALAEKVAGAFKDHPEISLPLLKDYLSRSKASPSGISLALRTLSQMGPQGVPLLTRSLKGKATSQGAFEKLKEQLLLVQKRDHLAGEVEKLKVDARQQDLTELERQGILAGMKEKLKALNLLNQSLNEKNITSEYVKKISSALVEVLLEPSEEVYQKDQKLLRILGLRAVPDLLLASGEKPLYISSKLPLEDFVAQRQRLHRRALGELSFMGEKALPLLLKAFDGADITLQKNCLMAMVQMEEVPGSALPVLVRALGSPSAEVRYYASDVFNKVGKDSIPYLIGALEDHQVDTQAAAAEALGKMGRVARSAIPKLLDRLEGKRKVALEAAKALSQIGIPDAKQGDQLVNALKSPHVPVRHYAVHTLAVLSHRVPSAAPALVGVLDDKNQEIRQMASLSLMKMGKVAVNALVPLLGKASQERKKQLLFILGRIGREAKEAVPSLAPLLLDKSEEVRNLTQRSLESITGQYFETPEKWKEWARQFAPKKTEKTEEKGKTKKSSILFPGGKN